MSSSPSRLFEPTKIGDLELKHRIVLAPLTRLRANSEHVHGDLAVEYYRQRSSVPGTLLISESVTIAAEAGGRPNVPGIWSEEQIEAWKKITDAVHEQGSFIFAQIRAYGRAADTDFLKTRTPPYPFVSASDVPRAGTSEVPRPLTVEEIKKYISYYTVASQNAIRAGFDGIELHGANSYLIDQFISSQTNKRTDEYGGSIENRCRFALETIESVANAIGQKRTSIRLSPWGNVNGMRMGDPRPTYEHLVTKISERFPDLAFLDVVEPGVQGNVSEQPPVDESNDFIRAIWAPRPVISAGSYTRDTAMQAADTKGDLIAFGRWFISNVRF